MRLRDSRGVGARLINEFFDKRFVFPGLAVDLGGLLARKIEFWVLEEPAFHHVPGRRFGCLESVAGEPNLFSSISSWGMIIDEVMDDLTIYWELKDAVVTRTNVAPVGRAGTSRRSRRTAIAGGPLHETDTLR
jgi:hypothetical protein